jgi:hypothetical protein
MILNEFFGKAVDPNKDIEKRRTDHQINDDVFWYIIDHDKLHKDFFHPLAKKIKKANEDNHVDKEEIIDAFMPMVNKGCKEYYHEKKLKGHLGKIFTKDLRQDTCERLYDHYKEDIVKGKYKLGENAQLDELSKSTLGSYIKKRLKKADDQATKDSPIKNIKKAEKAVKQDVPRAMGKYADPKYGKQGISKKSNTSVKSSSINEDVENIFQALINKIITNETVSYYKRK